MPPQEEEHGVLVGDLLDQPHVMRQDELALLVPAPTPKYKRQVTKFGFEFYISFQVGADQEASDCCACHCIVCHRGVPRTSRLELVGGLAAVLEEE